MAFSLKEHGVRVLLRKVRRRLKKVSGPRPEGKGTFAQLPEGGEKVSVEKALNSRCSSDHDNDPTISHWGMFDGDRGLAEPDIPRIIELSEIRRLSSERIGIRAAGSHLHFLADPDAAGPARIRMMIESGMQQQAVSLVCSALGVGSLILNMGLDGRLLPDGDLATVRMELGAMKPSYGGSYWSTSPPDRERAWRPGNLPDPARDGSVALLAALRSYRLQSETGRSVDERSLGQVLWAARGRTPHFYNCTPWGMTIPTWTGKQDITSLTVLNAEGLFRYVNWHDKRPTHSLIRERDSKEAGYQNALGRFPPWDCFIILSTNEPHGRALWEIGYQLMNILLQAYALDLAYRLFLLDKEQYGFLPSIPKAFIPIAMIGLKLTSATRGLN